jgi:6-phosphogluconolactonase
MTHNSKAKLDVFPDPDALARGTAEWLLKTALSKDGAFAIALSGGSTPKRLYELLARPPYLDRFPWTRVHWFWGDERFVPYDDPLSNYRMAQESLLAHVPAPPANIHPIPTEGLGPEAAARAYEDDLMTFYGAGRLDAARPLFDVTLLGLGEDGHTASLFPGSAALDERERWTAAVEGVKAEPRITLTYPLIENSRRIAFLIAGHEKRAVFAAVRRGDQTLPAARLHPMGELIWFTDRAAAGPEAP